VIREGPLWSSKEIQAKIVRWKEGIKSLNVFAKDKNNRQLLEELLTGITVEPLPISFDAFQKQVLKYLSEDAAEVALNSIINHDLGPLEDFGGEKETVEYIGALARKYATQLRGAYAQWKMVPLQDWFRINTEITLREGFDVYFSHIIMRNDGDLLRFSGTIAGAFILTDHLVRQLERATQLLGEEAILWNINPDKIEELAKRVENLGNIRRELDEKISKLGTIPDS
jgi:hypothetical protein